MRKLLGITAAVALLTPGCVIEVDFDPFGTDFTVEGNWTVNGAAPTAESCGGVASVQLALFDASTLFTYDRLTFPCTAGGFTGVGLEYGSYDAQWRLLDEFGGVIATGDRFEFDVFSGTNAKLDPVDFEITGGFDPFGTDFRLSGDWTVNGAPPTAESCGPIANVRIILWNSGTFFPYDELTFPCAQGTFQTAQIFAFGTYESQWQALGAGGEVLDEGDRLPLVVTNQVDVGLATQDFAVTVSGPVTLNLEWQDKDGTYLNDCNLAGVGVMSYTLRDQANEVVDMMVDIGYGIEIGYPDLLFGTYSLYVEGGMNGAPSKDWMVTCTGITHEAPGNAFVCQVEYVGT